MNGRKHSAKMPDYLRIRTVGTYNLLRNRLPDGTNPIKRLDLVVSGRDNEVYLTEIDDNNQPPQQGQPVRAGQGNATAFTPCCPNSTTTCQPRAGSRTLHTTISAIHSILDWTGLRCCQEFRRIHDDTITKSDCEVIFTYFQSRTLDCRDVSLDLKLSDQFVNIPGPDAMNIFLEQCKPNTSVGKGDITFPVTSSSVFQSTNINYVLCNLGIEQLVIAGHLTERGVEAAVRDAADLGYFVTVAEDACTAQTLQQHNTAILNMWMDFAQKMAGLNAMRNTTIPHPIKQQLPPLSTTFALKVSKKAAETVEHQLINVKSVVSGGTLAVVAVSVPADKTSLTHDVSDPSN
jgi:Isochorismatase family